MSNYFLLKSKDRTSLSTSSSDFKIQLINPINGTYELVSAAIPNTIYTFDDDNDTNKIYFFDGGSNKTASIAEGIYNSTEIAAAIKTAMDAAGSETYTITLDDTTQKLTFAATGNFYLRFADNEGASERLGLDRINTDSDTSYTAPNVINLALPHALIIDLDRNENFESSGNDRGTIYIPFDVGSSDIMNYKRDENFSQTIKFDRMSLLTVKLKDSDNNYINLNGANWELLLKKIN